MDKEITKIIKLEDFLNNHILTNLKVDRDNTYALYFENSLDLSSNKYNKTVMHLNLDGFKLTQIDLPFQPDDFYIDQKGIIFKVIKKGSTVFYLYNKISKKIKLLITIPFEVKLFAFSGSKIYFTAIVQDEDSNRDIKCSQRGPFYLEGHGIISNGITGLFQSDYEGKDIALITSLDMDTHQVDFDFDNNQIVFSAFKKENIKPASSAVYLYDINKETLKLLHNKNYRISSVKSMTEELVLITGIDLNKYSRNNNQRIYQIEVSTGISKVLGNFLDKSNENPGVVTDSFFTNSLKIQKFKDDFYFIQVTRDREMLYRIKPDGKCKAIDTGIKNIGSFHVSEKGIVIIGLKSLKLSEVYFFSNKVLRQVSYHNNWQNNLLLSKAERMVINIDEVEIDGYIYAPVKLNPDKKYPAVMMIHGGPKMIYSDIYAHDIQLLCANGYYVYCINPMGSDGRGDEFSNIRGRFGDLPYKQLISFTNKILEKYPQIDTDRLGVSGGSYGGYLTNYIITHTNRFKAAVSERGISNLMTSFTLSDIGSQFVFEYLGNRSPWMDTNAVIDASPVYQADKVTTPTLFIHGKNDYRCHYTESLNMFSALNYHGIETKLCLFDGENHGLVVRGKPQSKKHRYKEFISWFDRFLKGEDCC